MHSRLQFERFILSSFIFFSFGKDKREKVKRSESLVNDDRKKTENASNNRFWFDFAALSFCVRTSVGKKQQEKKR
jgi:hypothetical protein